MSPGNGRALTALTHGPASTAAAMNAHEATDRCQTSALGVVRPFWASVEADGRIYDAFAELCRFMHKHNKWRLRPQHAVISAAMGV